MPRPTLFIDLAGTLILRDPQSRQWVAWTGVAGLLHTLARTHDLHLTTGDSDAGARAALDSLEVTDLFSGIHADLTGGGKPFGALARALGVPADHCLALGDNPVADTAGDSDQVVSLIVRHERAQVPTARVGAVLAGLWADGGFLAGFEAALAAGGEPRPDAPDGPFVAEHFATSHFGDDCRLGWWRRTAQQRRPVVTLTA
jgi:hypothetical protein